MIVDEHIAAYIDSLAGNLPDRLYGLEQKAILSEVPIIRKPAQELLRFLFAMRHPKRILEIGTAVGFSCSLMASFMDKNSTIVTVEKVPMRVVSAKENLAVSARADDITFFIGDANDVLKALTGEKAELQEIFFPGKSLSVVPENEDFMPSLVKCQGYYDFIFLDAAKGQYLNFLPYLLRLMSHDGILVTDNVLQEGSIADSKFSITRRDRTIHKRMREYLYTITHSDLLETTVLPVGDGITLSVRKEVKND